jgi:thioredoxin reductase (NADPH)
LETLTLRNDATETNEDVRADALFVLIGARPHTGWLPEAIKVDKHGFITVGTDLQHDKVLDDWPMARAPYRYETSVPGVFAVGDVRSRSLKRVASSVGEGSGAISNIHQYLETWEKYDRFRRVT